MEVKIKGGELEAEESGQTEESGQMEETGDVADSDKVVDAGDVTTVSEAGVCVLPPREPEPSVIENGLEWSTSAP
jgi:hypothetical protein